MLLQLSNCHLFVLDLILHVCDISQVYSGVKLALDASDLSFDIILFVCTLPDFFVFSYDILWACADVAMSSLVQFVVLFSIFESYNCLFKFLYHDA